MPPVRWKTFEVISTVLIIGAPWTIQAAEDTIAMSSDGWRPIVGSRREPPYQDEIKYYRNPSFLSETVKAETVTTTKPTVPTTTATSPKPTTSAVPVGNVNIFNSATSGQILRGKAPPISKHKLTNHIYILPSHGSHGPHIPLRSTSQSGKTAPGNKLHAYITTGKRPVKPMRIQVQGAHSTRQEIYLPPPSGPHSPYKGQNIVKIRETAGLGVAGIPSGVKHYHLHQTPIDYGNRFSPQNDVYQQYSTLQNFVPKPTQQPDSHFALQNDDYTRNLVPPPYKGKTKNKPTGKPSSPAAEASTTVRNLHFNVNNQEFVHKTKFTPQIIDVQVPPPLESSSSFNFKPSQKEKAVELQVTKEELQVFHNSIPPNYNFQQPEFFEFNNYRTVSKPTEIPPPVPQKAQTYEVTEDKIWHEVPDAYRRQQFASRAPEVASTTRRPSLTELKPPTQEAVDALFLPTPFKPDSLLPTSPTQSEVSTIFEQLSQKQRNKPTANPSQYDVKEVSTHYPILGNLFGEFQTTTMQSETMNEITTNKPMEKEVDIEEPPRIRQRGKHRRRRPGHRFRTTTEESLAVTENYDYESKTPDEEVSRRPLRRRPIRYRTTTPSAQEEEPKENFNRHVYRKQPQRVRVPQIEEVTTQHFNEESYPIESATQKMDYEDQATDRTNEEFNRVQKPNEENNRFKFYQQSSAYEEHITEQVPTTNVVLKDSVREETTAKPEEETVTIREIFKENIEETTLATTTAAATEATTTKPQVLRRRPIKYDTNRPRFSVKEYRQRLNQYTSTTTTEAPRSTTEASPRTRYGNRFRRPTTPSPQNNEATESSRSRQRYTTKETNDAIITDKPVKAVNTRLRPFGRYRSTTEATSTTQKVSIRPNIFNSLKRPTPISLRKRIHNKQKNNTEEATTTTEVATTTVDVSDDNEAQTSVPYTASLPGEISTEFDSKRTSEEGEEDATLINDIMRNESILQRVSDLTSSAKDTPGLFKSVAPMSRRVPSYFTIATDDPILPIESVFANIRENSRT